MIRQHKIFKSAALFLRDGRIYLLDDMLYNIKRFLNKKETGLFFIGIFGIEEKEKHIKDFTNVVCPDCGRMTKAVMYERFTYLHIFFIPTFRWNRHYYIKLRCCSAVYEAPADYANILKTSGSIDFLRLTKISSGFGWYDDGEVTCPNCKKRSSKSFEYCPYCGTKL